MRGGVVLVACACGAATALLAPQGHAFQLPWRGLPQSAPAVRFGSRRSATTATSSIERGRSGGGGSSTRRHATSLFGLEGLLQPVLLKKQQQQQQRREQREHPQQQQQQQHQGQECEEADVAAVREQLERGVSRLAVTFGWCLSPADQAYLNEAWTGLKPSLAHLSRAEVATVEAALEVAYHAHLGQRRKSGEPYIIHPVSVAQIVADMGMDGETVAAALLHDTVRFEIGWKDGGKVYSNRMGGFLHTSNRSSQTNMCTHTRTADPNPPQQVEDTLLRAADVEAVFGPTVRSIVEAETKVSRLPRQLVNALEAGLSDKAAANLCHLVFACARDWRVVVVKLADRLHNCRTLAFMSPAKQLSVAKETLAVYVPLAERLGLEGVRAELEELSFQYLHPLEHAAITAAMASRQELLASLYTNRFGGARMTMDAALTEALPRLLVARGSLKGHRVTAALEGADPFQVFRRRAARGGAQGEGLEEERDLLTLRVVVSSSALPASASPSPSLSRRDAEAEHALCTRVLEAVEAELHAAVPVEGGKREDFVRYPRANGYQALHSVLRVPGLPYPLQVRVQTEEMERVARHGLLALYGWASSSSASSSSLEAAAGAVPLALPWLEAISARTKRAVLLDPTVSAAQLIASLQEELAVKQLEWAAAAEQAAAAGGRLRPTEGDVLEFVVRSAMAADAEQEGAGAMASSNPASQLQQRQQQQAAATVAAPAAPRFWQSPVFLWPWCLIGNDDFTTAARGTGAGSRRGQGHRELQRQARGAVTALRRPQAGAFDSGELQWLREAEQRHGRMALALLAYWGLQLLTDWANAASATALAAADHSDFLAADGSAYLAGGAPAGVDVNVLLQALLATPWGLPAVPSLSPELLAVVGAGELVGAVLPNTLAVNKELAALRRERRQRQRRRLMGAAAAASEEESIEEVEEDVADAQAAMAATENQPAVGFIPLVGGSASAGSSGVASGALLRLEAPWGLVRAFEGLVRAEKAMGRLGMLTVLLLIAFLT